MRRLFFYGLFMDSELLEEKGLRPRVVGSAALRDFQISIGARAALTRKSGSVCYGVLMELTEEEETSLYSGPGVSDYLPEQVSPVLLSGGPAELAVCYNLPEERRGSEANSQYAEKLSALAQRLGFPPAYVSEIVDQ